MTMNRYATYVSKDSINMLINNIYKFGGTVVSVSCFENGYLVIYKSDKIIREEVLKDFGN